MMKRITTSDGILSKVLAGPTMTLYRTNRQQVEIDGQMMYQYDEYAFNPGEYDLVQAGILIGGEWDDTLREIERSALYREADDMIAKYSTDVPDEGMRQQWIAYKHAVRATQSAEGYPAIVQYPTRPE